MPPRQFNNLSNFVFVLLAIWVAHVLITTESKCPPLPFLDLPNGRILPMGRNGYRLECKENYYLGGPSVIRCYKGNWTTTRNPICIYAENRCYPAPSVENAKTFGSKDTLIGSTVQYLCHEGYVLLGNDRRTCLEGGSWSGITPVCINETEPLQAVAERFGKDFVEKLQASTNDSGQGARYLDSESIQNGLELVILIDRSSSVDPHDLDIAKQFIIYLFQRFGLQNGDNPSGTRSAVLAFGSNVDVIFNLDNELIDSPMTAAKVLDKELQPNGGGTAMVPALTDVFLKVEPLLRPHAKRALFLISDGEPNVGNEGFSPQEMADELKDIAKFEIFAVGIGPDANRTILAGVASEPIFNHLFLLRKYGDLENIMDIIRNRPTEEPPAGPEKCGHLDERAESWPWMGAVYVSRDTEQGVRLSLCAAVLFCSQWVLTAASCFYSVHGGNATLHTDETFVVLGENHLLKVDRTQMNFYVKQVIIYPTYKPLAKLLDNLALIELSEPAPLDKFRTVCLPPTDRTIPLHLNLKLNASVAGWGNTLSKDGSEMITAGNFKFTQEIKPVTLSEEQECRTIVNKRIPANSIFCAETKIPKDSCLGIPGSPIVGQDPDTNLRHVTGILSTRQKCSNSYSQYTDLRKYIPWINEKTKNCHFVHYN